MAITEQAHCDVEVGLPCQVLAAIHGGQEAPAGANHQPALVDAAGDPLPRMRSLPMVQRAALYGDGQAAGPSPQPAQLKVTLPPVPEVSRQQ